MSHDLRLRFQNYRIVRSAGHPADGSGRYDVQRPDGSYCCRSVLWADVEEGVMAALRNQQREADEGSEAVKR